MKIQSLYFKFTFSLILLSIFFLTSCAQKQEVTQIEFSGNRNMGIYLRSLDPSLEGQSLKPYFQDLFASSLKATYAPQVQILDLPEDGLLESPESIFEIGRREIDDIFLIELSSSPNFSVPPSADLIREEDDPNKELTSEPEFLEASVQVVNGENLRTVTRFRFQVSAKTKENFEKNFIEAFQKSAQGVLKNPNIYPKNNPLHYANLLFSYANNLESSQSENLTCETAQPILEHYVRAQELYERGRERAREETSAIDSQQEKAHELNQKIDDSRRKSAILELCKTDQNKSFELQIDYGSLDASFHPFIQKAIENAKLPELLQKYTTKPVQLRFAINDSSQLSLNVGLRFDPERYKAWTMQRIPEVAGPYHILSFDPYYALMQTLIYVKAALPKDSPRPLLVSFARMDISLELQTLLNGSVTLGVGGQYIADEKRVSLAYPKSVILQTPSFEKIQIDARSDEIFQKNGWMALSSCKTLDGTITEDGLLMRFFGRDCKI